MRTSISHVSVLSILVTSLVPGSVRAQRFGPPANPGLPVTDLPTGIAGIITTVLLLVGVLALGFLVYGGFKYITAQGDERQIDEAKKTISGAVIGILVIGLALAIVLFVSASVGVFG